MAIPPLSADELRSLSARIVVVDVAAVYSAVVEVEGRERWTDTRYCIEANVVSVEKGDEAIEQGGPLYVHAWSPRDRPDGWAGSSGNRDIPERGDRVRVYLRQDGRGRLHVLEPNGFESL